MQKLKSVFLSLVLMNLVASCYPNKEVIVSSDFCYSYIRLTDSLSEVVIRHWKINQEIITKKEKNLEALTPNEALLKVFIENISRNDEFWEDKCKNRNTHKINYWS